MFKLFFATPDKKIVSDVELDEVTLPAHAGELNILPGHAPLMTTLTSGTLKYKLKNGQSDTLAISWGYCQISDDGVTVIAETAVHADEIEVRVVEEHLKQNENKMLNESLDDADFDKVQREILRLRSELDLIHQKH